MGKFFFSMILWMALCPMLECKVALTAELKKCYINTTATGTNETCRDSIVLLVTMESDTQDTENIIIEKVKTAEGERALDPPVKVQILKEEDTVAYPLNPLREFNSKPTEYVRYLPYNQCEISGSSPSCGYVVDGTGTVAEYSSGYCCRCSDSEVFGLESKIRRGNPSCSFGSSAMTAHCLRMTDLWFLGSRIKSPVLEYTTAVQLTASGEALASVKLTKATKDVKVSTSSGLTVRATLLAAFPSDFNDMTSEILLIPSTDDPGYPVLHLPETYFTLDGRECNKIGVSFEAFYSEGTRCFKSMGSCLANQILDIIAEDEKRVVPRHILRGYSRMSSSFFLVMPTRSTQLLTIEIDAAIVSIKVPLGTGVVKDMRCTDLKEIGWCNATIENTGLAGAGFTLSVVSGIYVENPSVVVFLEAAEERMLPFIVRNTANKDSQETVVFTLLDADSNVLFVSEANVTVTKTDITKGSQGGTPDSPQLPYHTQGPLQDGTSSQDGTSCTSCPWYSPFCFFARRCFLESLLLTAAVIGAALVALYLVKNGYLTACLRFVFKSEKKKEGNEKDSATTPNEETTERANPILNLPRTVQEQRAAKDLKDPDSV